MADEVGAEGASYHLAPSLRVLTDEINARWGIGWPRIPGTSDGWIGDPDHSARYSDHNPNKRRSVNAVDVDKRGIAPVELIRAAIATPRTNYVIHNHTIWNDDVGFSPRPYHGSNPHTSHVHISIKQAPWAEQDTSPWGLALGPKDDMMLPVTKDSSKDTIQYWQRIVLDLNPNALPRFGADGDYGDETTTALLNLFDPDRKGSWDGRTITSNIARLLHRRWILMLTGRTAEVDVQSMVAAEVAKVTERLRTAL